MGEQSKFINYARDDVFIISINKSSDRIEECEAQVYMNTVNVFAYYGLVSALYSKLHRYITKSDIVNKELKSIRVELYKDSLIFEINNKRITNSNKIKFLKLFDRTVNVYRHITNDLPATSIFPMVNMHVERKIHENLLDTKE